MMNLIDIACIVFVCVTANHLGLVSAIEASIKAKLLVVNCPKCLTFWVTMGYGCCGQTTIHGIMTVLAVSFLASYTAIWLELFEGFIDSLYIKCYEKIYANPADDETAADTDEGHSAGTMSELQ